MLRAVTIENFILFEEKQRVKFEDGAYFFIGENGSGKSSFFELIRRCLSNEMNMSISNIHDPSKTGYVVCEYRIDDTFVRALAADHVTLNDSSLFVCIFSSQKNNLKDRDGNDGMLYKVVYSPKGNDTSEDVVYVQSNRTNSEQSSCSEYVPRTFDDASSKKLCLLFHTFTNSLESGQSSELLADIMTIMEKSELGTANAGTSSNSKQMEDIPEDIAVTSQDEDERLKVASELKDTFEHTANEETPSEVTSPDTNQDYKDRLSDGQINKVKRKLFAEDSIFTETDKSGKEIATAVGKLNETAPAEENPSIMKSTPVIDPHDVGTPEMDNATLSLEEKTLNVREESSGFLKDAESLEKETEQAKSTMNDVEGKVIRRSHKKAGHNTCEQVLRKLEKHVVVVFGKRSIDPSEWTKSRRRSKRISAVHRSDYYESAKTKTEILSELLSKENLSQIDTKLEQAFFSAMIFPQRYEFELDDKTKECVVKNKNTDLKTSILKTSEGIIEAKELSLMLSNRSYQTICIQNPEKGMHPTMIEKFRDLVLHRIKGKVVLISSHHQGVITDWTISRTYKCRFEVTSPMHSKTSIVSCKDLSQNALAGDEFKKLPFSAFVLFVEGISDKKILRSVLHHTQRMLSDNENCSILRHVENSEKFYNFITLLNIICQDGATKHLGTFNVCKSLGIPRIFVYDKDVFVDDSGCLKKKCLSSYIPEDDSKLLHKHFREEDLCEILERHGIFMWRVGKIEQVIWLTCGNNQRRGSIKKDAKARLSLPQADFCQVEKIAQELIEKENTEIVRFFKFLERTADRFISNFSM